MAYDNLPAAEAVLAAWIIVGVSPETHEAARREVRRQMPLLGRALDRLAREDDGGFDQGYVGRHRAPRTVAAPAAWDGSSRCTGDACPHPSHNRLMIHDQGAGQAVAEGDE